MCIYSDVKCKIIWFKIRRDRVFFSFFFAAVKHTVREKNVPVFGKIVISRLQFRQFCFDLKEKVDILKPEFWATK
jgi:hypothetical protein